MNMRKSEIAALCLVGFICGCSPTSQADLDINTKSPQNDAFFAKIDLSKAELENYLSGHTVMSKRGFIGREITYFSPDRRAASWTSYYQTIIQRKWEIRPNGTRKISVTGSGNSVTRDVRKHQICALGYKTKSKSILNNPTLNPYQCVDSIAFLQSEIDRKPGDALNLLNTESRKTALRRQQTSIR